MDWLEILDLIEPIGGRKWAITMKGKAVIADWCLVSPEAVESLHTNATDEIIIQPAPAEIEVLLRRLEENPELHQQRNTYNIWVPSPNRIDNLRSILQYACERITKTELFAFISKEFNLKTSSVDSMLPFMKASGLIEEVGRSIYSSTAAAKAWLETGNDLDFIRILHAHMRFVGEMIKAAEKEIVRNDLYSQAKEYGLNAEKARWIAGFLIEAGLLEEPQYLHLKATALGKAFLLTLPLANPVEQARQTNQSIIEDETTQKSSMSESDGWIESLVEASVDPMAEGKQSGVAFEEEIAYVFRMIGFDAKRIGGSGDTDVVVRWCDDEGNAITAIVDGKSKTSGQVSHSDISDVAIETHKEKNNATYVAIIGPAFSGETIKNHARKKGFALITASELAEIARASQEVGLTLQEISLLFQVPDGLSRLTELISERQRKLEIVTAVIAKMNKEQDDLGVLSPRDMFLLLRDNSLSPSLEELLDAFDTLSKPEIGVLKADARNRSPENILYSLNNARSSVCRLRGIATAIERGILE